VTDPAHAVWLVGAGPGDPGLLTVRGREVLAEADCVVHDYLVGPRILALVPPGAAVHDVGKRGHATSKSQGAINDLLLECARRHRRVVRLKGGDPFVFGRGGEEAQVLAAAGIPFVIVPGVTSGIAVPAYAGIPVTHRASSAAVAFVAGHRQAGEAEDIDWATFARVETLVLYMGMQRLAEHCAALIEHGRPAETPAAAIQWGTLPRQRCVSGTLATLPALVAAAGLGAPAITVIGEVVRYRDDISWFDNRPLSGRRVLVTRAAGQGGRLATALEDLGAEAVCAPLQRFLPGDAAALDAALAGRHAWIAFASTNAVDAVFARLEAAGRDLRALAPARLAAVGPGTAEALRRRGALADLVPPGADAPALAEALIAAGGSSALLPQSAEARPELAATLRAAGWQVASVTAYRPEALAVDDTALGHLDAIAIASAATAGRLATSLGPALAARRAGGCRIVAIGARTAAACASLGFPADAVAEDPSAEGIAQAVAALLGATP
jgi:uroporphyrinogen III methyltransferase/synthase